jgi:hypothetical protein
LELAGGFREPGARRCAGKGTCQQLSFAAGASDAAPGAEYAVFSLSARIGLGEQGVVEFDLVLVVQLVANIELTSRIQQQDA